MDRRVLAALLAFLLVSAPALHSLQGAPLAYQVEDLGTTADGLVPTVTGINASGQVSGSVNTPAGLRAVRFTDGAGWAYIPGLQSVFSVATAINASGDVTGYYSTPAGLRAFRYGDSIGLATIGVLPGGTFTQGQAIADNGEVVGNGNSSSGSRGWRTGPGLGTLPFVPTALSGSTSSACGVNAAGQMVGAFTTGGFQHAYRLETNGSLTDIGTLGGTTSSACGLDVDGRVGGQSRVGADTHAFVFSAGAPTDVHTFVSTFSVIMSMANGVGVGSFNFTPDQRHAFVHTAAGGATDLNSTIPAGSSWILTDGRAVSSNGQIAGHGLVAGVPRVFRLTPGAAADTTAPVIASASATPSSVTPPNKRLADVAFTAAATDDQDPSPVCAASAVDGHGAPSGDFSITGPLSGRVRATGGAIYSFTLTCSDDAGNASSRSVDVVVPADNTVPVFTSLSATPSTIWPPKGQMVTVTTSASATDDSGETPTCTLDSITGPGTSPADFNVTGANTGSVKAVGGRTYTFNETCVDGSGNGAWSSVTVTVPPDVTAPVISTLSASPDHIWPPNGKMETVTLSVTATDNVDAAPTCSLTSITGAPASAAVITGALTANVRSDRDAVYTLNVTCGDRAGNKALGSVKVAVSKDSPSALSSSSKK
jgi:probable HAF family extracellular repeat protein